MSALSGLHIVVTRPAAQAAPWAEQLRALGAKVTCASLLEIRPVQGAEQQQAIKNCILELDRYHKIIFVSQNAVEHGCDWIDTYWPQLPIGVEMFAVGETTARQLLTRDFLVTDLAQSQSGAMTSETLLQAPGLQEVEGERILIMRGLGGRPQLGQVLEERGARVDYCELYERRLPDGADHQFAQLAAEVDELSADTDAVPVNARLPLIIALHSGEALENLLIVLGLRQSVLNNCYLLVPSQRVLELAQVAGLTQLQAAQNATDACMLQGLLDLKHKLALSQG